MIAPPPSPLPLKKMPDISLIIVNYKGFSITKNCVESICRHSGNIPYEVIVVDNASSDNSVTELKKMFGNKKGFFIIARRKNDFLTAAYNEGFRHSRGKIVVFMNNDIVVTKGWLINLVNAFSNPQVGIAGVSMLDKNGKIDNLGCSLDFLCYGHRINTKSRKIDFIPASLLAIRRYLFSKAGLFDEFYQGNYEDVDLALRIKKLGYKIVITENSCVYHLGSWTVNKYLGNVKSSYLCRRNRLRTILKHKIYILPLYLLLQVLIFIKELAVDRNSKLSFTTPQAVWDNIKIQ